MSRSDSERSSKPFIDIIKCYLCSKVYSSPRLLPCMHTFCLPCLERHGIEKKPGDTVPCPLCLHEFRLSTKGFIGLPRNMFVEELTEVNKMAKQAMLETQCDKCFELATSGQKHTIQTATVHCNDCASNLCTTCCRQGSLHSTDTTAGDDPMQRHTVIELNQYLQRLYKRDVTYCELHPEEAVGLYCFDCRTTLCTSCNIDGGHRVHKCAGVERAASEFRHHLELDTLKVVERYNKCRDTVKKVQLERQDFISNVQEVGSGIRRKGEEMKKLIDAQVNELLGELADIQAKALDKLDSVRDELERFLSIADSFVRYTEAVNEHGTPLDISRSGHDLVARATVLHTLPFVASGADYRTPLVTFKPWYDLSSLLTNEEENVVGSLTTVMKAEDGNPSFSYFLNPSFVKTVHQDAKAIIGVAAMSGHVIIVRVERAEIELYSAVTWSLQRRLAVPGLHTPTDLTASEELSRIFVSDYSNNCVHYCDLEIVRGHPEVNRCSQTHGYSSFDDLIPNGRSNGGVKGQCQGHDEPDESSQTKWLVEDSPWSLSLSQKGDSLVVICDQVRKLYEYTLHGSVLRQVCLISDLVNPRHALLLNTGQFVVSFIDFICLVGPDGKRCNQSNQSKQSASSGRINASGRLAVDNKGHVIVLDVEAKRILQLNANGLEFIREVVPCDNQLRYAARLCVDSIRDRMYVADNELTVKSRLSMKSNFWGKTGRLVIYNTKSTF